MKLAKVFLAGLLGVTAASMCVNDSKNNVSLENRIASTTPSSAKIAKESIACKSIKDVFIRDFLRNYLDSVTPHSDNFKKLEKKYGKEGLLEEYASAHELCFNLAFESQGREITDEIYSGLARKLGEKQQETSKGVSPVNNLDKSVLEVYEKWGRKKAEFFRKLLEAAGSEKPESNEREYALKLIKKAYTEEDYKKYTEDFCSITDELYGAMKKTLGIGVWFDSGQFKTIAEYTRRAYLESVDKYFQKKDGK